jgi:hypothetical protein
MIENKARDVLVETRVSHCCIDGFDLFLIAELTRFVFENNTIQKGIAQWNVHVTASVVR